MIWDFIKENMKEHPKSWLFDGEQRITFQEFLEKAAMTAQELTKRYQSRTKCAILCSNQYHTALAILSCWCADLIPVTMSMNYGYSHCNGIIETTEPAIILTDDLEICRQFDFSSFNFITMEEIISRTYPQIEEECLQKAAILMSTSGTTGTPKGVIITETGLQRNVLAIKHYFKVDETDTVLIARPLYHCSVLTSEYVTALVNGVNIVFASGTYNPFLVFHMLVKYEITFFGATPTLLAQIALCSKREHKETKVHKIAVSGECLTKETARKIRDCFRDAEINNVYGLTESGPRATYLPAEQFDRIPESVGIGLIDTYIKIVDDTGKECEPNQQGNILILSPSIMRGYYHKEELTRQKIVDGWLHTGDIGYKDWDGYLYVLSRADDMIIKAGMNIYPKQIENRINELKEINDCVAYRVQQKSSQAIGVDVVLESEFANLTIGQLLQLFQTVLEDYEIPTYITVVEQLKRNASGKLIRQAKTEADFKRI